jgi:hypothetical protein
VAVRGGGRPDDFLARARASLTRAQEVNPDEAEVYRVLAEVELRRAEGAKPDGDARRAYVDEGLAMAAKAQSINPKLAEAVAVEGALRLLVARTEPGSRHDAAERSLAALKRAVDLNPLLGRELAPLLAEAEKLKSP